MFKSEKNVKNTAIIILNWNGAEDTINCVNSLLNIVEETDRVFIVDNHSKDGSVQQITSFLSLNRLVYDDVHPEFLQERYDRDKHFYIVRNRKNLGFGSGINIVLRQLKELDDRFEYVWLLNNDAVVDEKTLFFLKQRIQLDDKIGAVGSIVLNYPDISIIQNTGVKHYPFLGVSKLVNKNRDINDIDFNQRIDFDYLNGASLMLRLDAVERVGYFDERYFVYSEEFDLQLSLKKNNYKVELEPNSKVYHKLMGSTRDASHLFFYYYCMSSILLTKKQYSKLTLIVATVNLSAIMIVRTFPSAKNFYWSIKGILKGLI